MTGRVFTRGAGRVHPRGGVVWASRADGAVGVVKGNLHPPLPCGLKLIFLTFDLMGGGAIEGPPPNPPFFFFLHSAPFFGTPIHTSFLHML